MEKMMCVAVVLFMVLNLAACDRGSSDATTECGTETLQELDLDPNLKQIQGYWAASDNYGEEDPDFLCSMPATFDENMKGYYVISIDGDQLVYKRFHKSGNNGRPGGYYDGNVDEFRFDISKITEMGQKEEQTTKQIIFKLDLLKQGKSQQAHLLLFDGPYLYNKLMLIGFEEVMNTFFVEIDQEEYDNLMDICSDVKRDIVMHEEVDPYVGMPKEQLENSTWGTPEDINITRGKNYVHEQWCYLGGRYVYVDDGVVSSIQE